MEAWADRAWIAGHHRRTAGNWPAGWPGRLSPRGAMHARARAMAREARHTLLVQLLRLTANGDDQAVRHTINRLALAGRYYRAPGADVLLTRDGVQPGLYLRGVAPKQAARRMLAAMGERKG